MYTVHTATLYYFYSISVPLPGYDKYGRKVIIDKSCSIDVDICPIEDRMRIAMMTQDMMTFLDPDYQVVVQSLL